MKVEIGNFKSKAKDLDSKFQNIIIFKMHQRIG